MRAVRGFDRVTRVFCVLACCLFVWIPNAAAASPAFEQVAGSPFAGAGGSSDVFSPDGRLLAAGVSVFLVSPIGTLARAPGRAVQDQDSVRASAFSPDGSLLAAADFHSGAVSIFTVSSAGVLLAVPASPFATGSQPESLAFSPDGSLLAVANSGSGSVSLFAESPTGALSPVTGSPFSTGAAVRVSQREVVTVVRDTGELAPGTSCKRTDGRCWARTSDLRLVETALSQLS
jgi:WD40 repeat protein